MADEPQEWQVTLVRDELSRASGVGEGLSRAELQDRCGVGSGDLTMVLSHLFGEGLAEEVTPDSIMARDGAPAPPVVDAPAPEQRGAEHRFDDDEFPAVPSLAEAERAADRGAPSAGGRPPAAERRVELPMGVAGALDEAALGKIVKAGIDEAQSVGAEFVLVVTP